MSTPVEERDETAAPRSRRDAGGARLKLTPGWRRLLLTAHLVAGVGWLGVAVAVLALTALDDPAAYAAMLHLVDALTVPPPFAIGIAAGITGVVLGLGSRWGIFRYRWLVLKILLVSAAFQVSALLLSAPLTDAVETGVAPSALVWRAGTQVALLTVVTALSVFKPWGRMRRG